jgi:xanthine dehydrogenase YagR molybdenum-binding subunit
MELARLRLPMLANSVSPLGAKGLAELTAVSVVPAISNAVYHATGKRIRDLPITIWKVSIEGYDGVPL